MSVGKAGTEDIEALVKMRLSYLIEDNGSLDSQHLTAIKRELPGYFQAHLDKDLGFVRLCDQRWSKHRFMRLLSDCRKTYESGIHQRKNRHGPECIYLPVL